MKTFEEEVIELVNSIRGLIALDDDAPNYFSFSVVAEGRVRDGEVQIRFKLGESDYQKIVTGDDVQAVVTEYLRRIGWQKAHDYLALAAA